MGAAKLGPDVAECVPSVNFLGQRSAFCGCPGVLMQVFRVLLRTIAMLVTPMNMIAHSAVAQVNEMASRCEIGPNGTSIVAEVSSNFKWELYCVAHCRFFVPATKGTGFWGPVPLNVPPQQTVRSAEWHILGPNGKPTPIERPSVHAITCSDLSITPKATLPVHGQCVGDPRGRRIRVQLVSNVNYELGCRAECRMSDNRTSTLFRGQGIIQVVDGGAPQQFTIPSVGVTPFAPEYSKLFCTHNVISFYLDRLEEIQSR